MNPWGLAFLALALVLIVVGWTGSYPSVWRMLTGRETTFGQGDMPVPAGPSDIERTVTILGAQAAPHVSIVGHLGAGAPGFA